MKTQLLFAILMASCMVASAQTSNLPKAQPYADKPFIQDYSIKYEKEDTALRLYQVAADRNGYIQLHSSQGLLRLRAGQFLYPGTLVPDVQYRPTSDKNIASIGTYENQLVYLDDKAVFSNAWAGKLYSRHNMPEARIFCGGKNFAFLLSDGQKLSLLQDSEILWKGSLQNDEVREIKYDSATNLFWILGTASINTFSPDTKKLTRVLDNATVTCIEIAKGQLYVGTRDGYFTIDIKTKRKIGEVQRKMPRTDLTTIRNIDGDLWFGSTAGAMLLQEDGSFDYYASKRWIPSDHVVDIARGPESSVLILTDQGLGRIFFKKMTLAEKADYYQKVVRERHIRNGFNSMVTGMTDGDLTTGSLRDSDNDGLWTSMYLAAEVFRYAMTKSVDALQNIRESLDAMERLYTINPMNSGFPSRSFERSGYNVNQKAWRATEDPEWEWKSTTSSDEAIGHVFVFGVIAELVDVEEIRDQAIDLLDGVMQHIVANDLYLVDYDGKPTTWGRWNPEYVNGFPTNIGDRKLNSSNIIAMLQSAYHFTQKEIYKETAFTLMNEHGYLENLLRPMAEIGQASEGDDDWSKMLSSAWNHSDDEMYYLGYWGLYRYAFNDELKAQYKAAIVDHWEAERPEQEGLWNIMTALVGDEDYDFDKAIWYLQQYPLDMIDWTVKNSDRKDIEVLPDNFRNQTIKEVLPPDELKISKHNTNRFRLDGDNNGQRENSPGDIWLLPYWMGRYLEVIGEPATD